MNLAVKLLKARFHNLFLLVALGSRIHLGEQPVLGPESLEAFKGVLCWGSGYLGFHEENSQAYGLRSCDSLRRAAKIETLGFGIL